MEKSANRTSRIDWLNQLVAFLGVLLGVLFAFGLTDWNDQRKERLRVVTALENLRAEILRNQEKIDSTSSQNQLQLSFMQTYLPLLDDEMEPVVGRDSIASTIAEFPRHLHPDDGLSMNFNLYQLSDISVETMTRTGLFGALDYELAFLLQQAYQIQDKLGQMDEDLIRQMRSIDQNKESIRPILRTAQISIMFAQALQTDIYQQCLEAMDRHSAGPM